MDGRSAEQTASNVQTVAASAEELSSSIQEISRQVTQSSSIAQNAVGQANRTEAMVGLLLSGDQEQAVNDKIPVGRMGTPEEIGGLCLFLASDAAAYVNGATIWADGGGGY